jgi:hypothetical protein
MPVEPPAAPVGRDGNGARSHRGSLVLVARQASDFPGDRVIVVTNPDEDCSPASFRRVLDDLLDAPEPAPESLGAAEALRELRAEDLA